MFYEDIVGDIEGLSESGIKLSNEASEKITEILDFITKIVELIKEISESSQNQSLESEKISVAINEISSNVSLTAKLAQDLDNAINSLSVDDV